VFNKIDLVDEERIQSLKQEYKDYNCVFVSVKKWIWFDDLKMQLVNKLK
jgi:50S ribosomal subunit-associated GTPase HflX